MFKIGDKVVYPMHGAGVIEAIEEKEILGKKRKYYIMKMPIGNMKVMIPVESVEEVGLRQVIDKSEIDKVIAVLKDRSHAAEDLDNSSNWNRRYKLNLEKIKNGDIFEVAEVVRNLICREKTKGLSTGERKMLENARRILISEIVLAQDTEEEKVELMIDKMFA